MKRLDQSLWLFPILFLWGVFLLGGENLYGADANSAVSPIETKENVVYDTPPLPEETTALNPPMLAPISPSEANEEGADFSESSVQETTRTPGAVKDSTSLTTASALLGKSGFLGNSKMGGTIKIALLFTVLSLVPAILMMTTSFVRIITVLSILRQGLGTGQIPPTQILTTIAIFMTFLVMTPTMTSVWNHAVRPYSEEKIDLSQAISAGEKPIRSFLCQQIERAGNTDSIWLFMQYIPGAEEPKYYEDIPWRALLPAFVISELKTAFVIGFQILLPFLIIDLVVSGVTVSMGMMMLPPAVVSLPLKLLLFVLADGWSLVVKTLLDGFVIGST